MKEEVKVFDASEARKVLERVHNFLGILIRENLVKDAPFLNEGELENESDLADDVWEVLQGVPRNCDVGTAEEQSSRLEEICDSHTCESRCSARRRLKIAEDARPVPASPNICDKANLVIREFEKAATRRPDGLTVIDCECSRLECAVEELKEALGETSCEGKR